MGNATTMQPLSLADASGRSGRTVASVAAGGDELERALAELESMSIEVLGVNDESTLEAGCLSCS